MYYIAGAVVVGVIFLVLAMSRTETYLASIMLAVGLPVRSKQVDERMTLVERKVRRAQPALVEGLEIWGVAPGPDGRIGRLKLGSLRGATVPAAR